ncbi:putative membrane-bound transcription factor site-2 protease, partial [Apostichopus japonicus]
MAKKLNGKLCEQHLHNVLLNGSIYTGSNKLTRSQFSESYQNFQQKWGVQLLTAQIRCYTTYFNRWIFRVGQWFPWFSYYWFELGMWFGIVCIFASVALLVMTLVKAFTEEKPEQVLTPVMPGVNVPVQHLSYFFAVLLVSGVLHELGHAIAAVREQVMINGFGVFVMVVYPGAFVDLHTEHLLAIPPKRQLKIYCAGIWHNFVLVLIGIIMLVTMPTTMSMLYATGEGVVVTELAKNSPVAGPRGFAVGSKLKSINGCPLLTGDDWGRCLSDVVFYPQSGYCQQIGKIKEKDYTVQLYKGQGGQVECCRNDSASDLCFYYKIGSSAENLEKIYQCLTARKTTEAPRCQRNSDCLQVRKTVCLYPSLDNSSRLIRVLHDKGPPVIYVGDPYLFGFTVSVSGYIPKYNFLPFYLPQIVDTFC